MKLYKDGDITNEELIKQGRAGDDLALLKLIEINEGFFRVIAKKYIKSGLDFDDLVSLAKMGIIKAYKSFDLTKGFKFITYAGMCCENEIRMHLRHKTKWDKSYYLDTPVIFSEDGEELSLLNILESREKDPEDILEDKEDIRILYESLKELSDRQKVVLDLVYFQDVTQHKVAEIVGVTQPQVSRILKKSLKQLNDLFSTKYGRRMFYE